MIGAHVPTIPDDTKVCTSRLPMQMTYERYIRQTEIQKYCSTNSRRTGTENIRSYPRLTVDLEKTDTRIFDWVTPFCIPFEEMLIASIIALVIGFVFGYLYIRSRITAIEERYRADLERWKVETAGQIRKDSVNRSRSTLKGKIAEQVAPASGIHLSSRRYPVHRFSRGLHHL